MKCSNKCYLSDKKCSQNNYEKIFTDSRHWYGQISKWKVSENHRVIASVLTFFDSASSYLSLYEIFFRTVSECRKKEECNDIGSDCGSWCYDLMFLSFSTSFKSDFTVLTYRMCWNGGDMILFAPSWRNVIWRSRRIWGGSGKWTFLQTNWFQR